MSSTVPQRPTGIGTCARALLRAALALALVATPTGAQALPIGFEWVTLTGNIDRPTAMAFSDQGYLFVARQSGKLRVYWPNGGFQTLPVVDLADEVNQFGDRGLLGMAVHPGYEPDGGPTSWIYLAYTVSPVPGVNQDYDTNDQYSFGRLTRYRTWFNGLGEVEAISSSRQVLLGNQLPDGSVPDALASLHVSHSNGSLLFADDGSLLLAQGEGAHHDLVDTGGNDDSGFDDFLHPVTLLKGPIPKAQDLGAFRAQSLESLAGKVLRLDPETGFGYPSNPFFDGDVASNASRVWALGLRAPFRVALLPGTGATDPGLGEPNPLLIGDVGWGDREELDLCFGGENFQWPCSEGNDSTFGYPDFDPPAPLAPNCNTVQIGLDSPPLLSFGHSDPTDMEPPGVHFELDGTPGPGVFGSTVVGGAWVGSDAYPAAHSERLYFADFGWSWIKTLEFDGGSGVLVVRDFTDGVPLPVDMAVHPLTGELHVLHYFLDASGGGVTRLEFPDPWEDLGFGLAGTLGEPVMTGTGTLTPGDPFDVSITNMLPASTAWIVYGFTELGAPLKGGVLVPDPSPPGDLIPVPTGAGAVSLPGVWPLDVPVGFPLWVQTWVTDPGGVKGVAASNALLGTAH
jgi:hypothetical protein